MIENQSDNFHLIDQLGRQINYLRISLTERCNFRCQYCYGTESLEAKHEKLTDDDLIILVKAFSLLGVNKIRLTGGEPLLRPSIIKIIDRISHLDGIDLIGLTTNGYLLASKLPDLINAGLNRLNISIDSLDPVDFRKITGCDGLNKVLKGIEIAELSDAFPWVKVNVVIMRGINDHEIPDFINWGIERKIDLRLIEYMPTQNTFWSTDNFIAEADMRQMIPMKLVPDDYIKDIDGPARRYKVDGYPGRISFISAVSRRFCKSCNRLRLNSSGQLIGCLFGNLRADLLPVLREGRNIDEIAKFISKIISEKGFRRSTGVIDGNFKPLMRAVGG